MNGPRQPRENKMNIRIPGYVQLSSHMLEKPNTAREKREQPAYKFKTIEERIKSVTETFGLKYNRQINGDGND